MPLEHDPVTAINLELTRIQEREALHDHRLGHGDRIHFTEANDNDGDLRGSGRFKDFHWFGPAGQILERLRRLPSGGGAEAIRSEFS
jgi:hypothetical protein